MRTKILLNVILSFFLVGFVSAQNSDGVLLYQLGEYDLAKNYFQENVSTDPGLDNYYLGQIAAQEGKVAEAKQYYEKSVANNSLYGEVGLASLNLKSDPKTITKDLEKLAKKNKKDSDLCIQIAKAFYDNNMMEEGDKIVSDIMKGKDTNPYVFILRGNVYQKKGDAGAAGAEYEQAINIDPNNIVALIKSGLVYEQVNPGMALEQFRKALQVDPSNKIVMRFMAKVYTNTARYPQAIALYKTYFENNTNKYNLEDLNYYARALYFGGYYKEAKSELTKCLAQEPNNFVFNRLMMYCDEKLKENEEGLKVADKFFSLRSSLDSGYIASDFTSYGKMLVNTGNIEEGIIQFNKAVELDPKNTELYKEVAADFSKSKLNLEAAKMIDSYIALVGDSVNAEDYFLQGRYNQIAAQALTGDSVKEQRVELLTNADIAYGHAIEKNPDSYLGYLSRAGVNALLDPQITTSTAKDLYEKALSIITESGELESRKPVVLGIYEYLAIYYFFQYDADKSKENKENAIKYCKLAQEISPDRPNINNILKELTK